MNVFTIRLVANFKKKKVEMKKIIQVLKSTTGKKVLYLTAAVTTNDKAAVLEVRPNFYLPIILVFLPI